ncbi:CBS domain-containing protein [Halopiger goleimassiliensis]|uniref:CBS domain-containing protein n=1 Tax=Halopiger goleimassiliensis TaxID=1293048 RepID=UPI0006781270|nr:CBS domain-containing protein [Halopiger goleimassiliensis]
MTLTEIATTDVVSASSDASVEELLEMMDDQMVGSVVITDGDEPTGIVTDRSIALEMRNADSIQDMTAEDVMAENPVTIEDSASHYEAVEQMSNEGIRRIPITEDGSLCGIITLDDLLMMTAAELSNASDVIEQQAGPS